MINKGGKMGIIGVNRRSLRSPDQSSFSEKVSISFTDRPGSPKCLMNVFYTMLLMGVGLMKKGTTGITKRRGAEGRLLSRHSKVWLDPIQAMEN